MDGGVLHGDAGDVDHHGLAAQLGDGSGGADVVAEDVKHHLGELLAGDIALGVELAAAAVDVPGGDHGGHLAGGPAGDLGGVGELGQDRGASGLQLQRAGQDGEGLLPGDVPAGLKGAVVVAVHDLHEHGTGDGVLGDVPGVGLHIGEAGDAGTLGGAEGADQDGRHFGAGEVIGGTQEAVGAVQKAVFHGGLQGGLGPVVGHIREVCRGRPGGQGEGHRQRQHHGEDPLAEGFHVYLSPFLSGKIRHGGL